MAQPAITKKQQEILSLISRFRFVDRAHIQTFLQHKEKRRINKWLKDLADKRYIRRIYDNSIIGKNRRTAIFSLESNGIKFVRAQGLYDKTFLRRLYWDKERSDTFIDRSLLIAAICCELEKKRTDALFYEYVTESDFSNSDCQFYILKNIELPVDLIFWKKENGKKPKYFLLTIFDATLPRYRIRKRLRDFKDFYFNNDWGNNIDTAFPILFFVCRTREQMIYAKRYNKTFFDDDIPEDLSFNFTTAQDVKEFGITGAIWEGI